MPTKNKPASGEKTKQAMEELLSSTKIDQTQIPKPGDLVEGKITEIGRQAIYLDLGSLGMGVIWGRELKAPSALDEFEIGDKISARVVGPEDEEGYLELSLREAREEKTWQDLRKKMKEKEILTSKILEANRGGLIVEINGVAGFCPVSQLTTQHYPRVDGGDKDKILIELKKFINKDLKVRIIDLDQDGEKLIVSEKAAVEEKQKKLIERWKIGEIIEGEITGVADFGAFVKFGEPPIEGLVHISELAWQLIEDPKNIVKIGDKVKAKIIGLDEERISLSIKALQKDPWIEGSKKYKKGQIVKGKVTKINPFGAFVQLDQDIHGLVHISELSEDKKDILKVDQVCDFKILSLEPKEHRLSLALVKKYK